MFNRCLALALLCASIFLFLACRPASPEEAVAPEAETPDVLSENQKSDWSLSSRYDYNEDIINLLFDEACEKDSALGAVAKRMESLIKEEWTLREKPKNYLNTNERYWRSLDAYTARVQDTLLRKDLNDMVLKLKTDYEERSSGLNESLAQLDSMQVEVSQRLVLMKILTTYPMMLNYQRNELPDLKPLDAHAKAQDSLAIEMDSHIEIPK